MEEILLLAVYDVARGKSFNSKLSFVFLCFVSFYHLLQLVGSSDLCRSSTAELINEKREALMHCDRKINRVKANKRPIKQTKTRCL